MRILAAMLVCLSATLVQAQQPAPSLNPGNLGPEPVETPVKATTENVVVTPKFLVILETKSRNKPTPAQSSPFGTSQFVQPAANTPGNFSTTTTDSVRVICDDLQFAANTKDGKREYSFSSPEDVTIIVEKTGEVMTMTGTECKYADGVLEVKDAKMRLGEMEMTATEFKLKLDVHKVSIQKQEIHRFSPPKGKPQPVPKTLGSPELPSSFAPTY